MKPCHKVEYSYLISAFATTKGFRQNRAATKGVANKMGTTVVTKFDMKITLMTCIA
jgi:hypothetical protein